MGDYVLINGTSFASPYASGVAALLISRHPGLAPFETELIMEMSGRGTSARRAGTRPSATGLVDAEYALRLSDVIVPEMNVAIALVDNWPFTIPPLFNTVSAALEWIPAGGAVIVDGGSWPETLFITKDVSIYRWDASAVIGK